GNWSVTNPHRFGGQHPQDGIFMDSEEGKFAIAQGNITTILETPIMNFSNSDLSTISLDFDQAFYFDIGDVAKIEISFDVGTTYNSLIMVYHIAGQPQLGWFTAGTAESLGRSEPNKYYFKDDNTSISLDSFLKDKTDICR